MENIKGNKVLFGVEFYKLVKKFFGDQECELEYIESLGFFMDIEEQEKVFSVLEMMNLMEKKDYVHS